MRKVLDGNIAKDARRQLKVLLGKGITKAQITKETGVNNTVINRILNEEPTTATQLDKIGKWISSNKL